MLSVKYPHGRSATLRDVINVQMSVEILKYREIRHETIAAVRFSALYGSTFIAVNALLCFFEIKLSNRHARGKFFLGIEQE